MHIKPQTVIPAGTKITKCPPHEGNAKSVWTLLRAEEKKLARAEELKEKAGKFAAALKAGFTADEALKLVNGESK